MKPVAEAYARKERIFKEVDIAINAAVLASDATKSAVARLKEVQRDYFELLIAKADKQIPLDVTEEQAMNLSEFILTNAYVPCAADQMLRQRRAVAKKRARALYSKCFPDATGNDANRDAFELLRKAVRNGDIELVMVVEEQLNRTLSEEDTLLATQAIEAQIRLMQGSKLFGICSGFYSGDANAEINLRNYIEATISELQAKLPLPVIRATGFNDTEGQGY